MSVEISLFDLVNLSVGSPEVGAVNFNALHSLLHAVVRHLGIQDVTAEWIGEHGGRKPHDPPPQANPPRGKQSPYHHVEDKLREIEKLTATLEALPNATDLLGRSTPGTTPVSDMWQLMQLHRKVQANEDGVSKCMALIQDLLNEIKDLRASRDGLQGEVMALHEKIAKLHVSALQDRVGALEKSSHQVTNLEKVMRELKDRLGQYPDPEELTQFITWDVLQEALVNQRAQQPPDSASPTQSEEKPLRGVGGGAERYPETVNALRRLSLLEPREDALEVRVDQLERVKADHAELVQLSDTLSDVASRKEIPDDLLDQIGELKTQLDGMMTDRDKSSALMNNTQAAILQLRTECEKLNTTTSHLASEQSQRQEHLDRLCKTLEQMEEKKADKERVEMEIDIKADKQALESKVSRVQFDSMTEQLSTMFQDLLSKISGQEEDWNKVIQKISTEMESKLNRIELDPLKQQLEERWKNIRKQLQAPPAPDLDDAAGIRRQLVARFHCISCDRPVDMMAPGPHLITVPAAPGMPSHRSMRPYTVYELEQVRQHYRSDKIPEMADYSYLARSCGGSHTMTFPNRRYTRLQHIAQVIQDGQEPPGQAIPGPSLRIHEEVDILGLDGHIYKGRVNPKSIRGVESRLPTITAKEGASKGKDKVNRSLSQKSTSDSGRAMPARPQSARTHWSHSASSSSVRDRPMSSLGCVSQSSIPQPPAPPASAHMDSTADASQGLVLHVDLGQSGEEEPVTNVGSPTVSFGEESVQGRERTLLNRASSSRRSLQRSRADGEVLHDERRGRVPGNRSEAGEGLNIP
ncbi:hypothetical protein GJAV_G00224440 [Gymnothorax javanicus]|nr:hypothetical protein GJAV_G00224440 [Gymnothorax javanicus]